MKRFWTWMFGATLVAGVGGLSAQENSWSPPARNPATTVIATSESSNSGFRIGRPVPQVEPYVQPQTHRPTQTQTQTQRSAPAAERHTSYTKNALTPLVPVVRAQQDEDKKGKTQDNGKKSTSTDQPRKLVKDPGEKPEPLPFAPKPLQPVQPPPVTNFGCDSPLPDLNRNYRVVRVRRAGDFCVEDTDCCQTVPWWGRVYFSGEYLLWWLKGAAYPPLITTSPLTVPENDRGRLGPNTQILFGNETLSPGAFSGGRFTLGFWMDPCKEWALETTVFFLGERSTRFAIDSSQVPVLARPIRILNQGGIEGREIFATVPTQPGDILDLRGSAVIEAPTQLWGIEANVRRNLVDNCCWRWDLLAGYRYVNLQDGLGISENVVTLRDVPGVPIFANDRVIVTDQFDTQNNFHGGQIGTTLECRWRRWTLESTFKIALGVNQQSIDVNGGMTVVRPNGTQTAFNGGLLALPSNIGRYTRDEFAAIPEVGVKLGWQVLPRMKLYVGYDVLYISNVVRPGDQIDRTIDIAQIPNFANPVPPNTTGQVRPVVPFRTTDFWAQGVNFGIEFKY